MKYTHDELCKISAKWLNEGGRIAPPSCPFVAVEVHTALDEVPDVFGWSSHLSVLIECKTSKSDYIKDFKKSFRANSASGVGEYRYFCCEPKLIRPEGLPNQWGLLWISEEGKVEVKREAERQTSNLFGERMIISSVMRRKGLYKRVFDYRERSEK